MKISEAEREANRRFWEDHRRKTEGSNWRDWPLLQDGDRGSVDVDAPIARALFRSMSDVGIVKVENRGDSRCLLELADGRTVVFDGVSAQSQDFLTVYWTGNVE